MSSGFKITIFCLIVVFAIATSQVSIGKTTSSSVKSKGTKASQGTKAKGFGAISKESQSNAKITTTAIATTAAPKASATAVTKAAPTSAVKRYTAAVTPVTRINATGVISQIPVSYSRGQILLKAPEAGSTTTIGTLFDLINTNNAAKTSNFLIFVPGSRPSSKSAGTVGLPLELLKEPAAGITASGILRNIQVTIKADDSGIIKLMENIGAFPKISNLTQAMAYGWGDIFTYVIENYPKILLYFQLPDINTLSTDVQNAIPQDLKNNWNQKFYIIDPWPQSSPIVWNKNLAPEQVCRAYRQLMNWTFN